MAFEIYKYNPNCIEWDAIRNSKLTGAERIEAFNECAKKIGTKLTLQEYFDIPCRDSSWWNDVCYICIGKPTNILEELAYSELEYHNELYYCEMRDRHPEDICESRTDWDSMRGYADSLADFIDRLKNEVGSGKLKYE